MDALDPEPLLRLLHEHGIEHILVCYCSLRRAVKVAAGRPLDLDDLQYLPSE